MALKTEFSAFRENKESLIRIAEEKLAARAPDPPLSENTRLEKRRGQLTAIIGKLYEDHAAGLLEEERMQALLKKYKAESEALEAKAALTKAEPSGSAWEQVLPRETLEKHLDTLLKAETLTQELLFRFIHRIEIFQGNYQQENGKRTKRQKIRIFFRFRTTESVREITL